MKYLVFIVAALFCTSALASGRAGPTPPQAQAWFVSDIAREAAQYVGSGKFTRLPGAWCADAVSAWLIATGHRPLSNRMAASALAYGPRSSGNPGDLAVFVGRRGYAYHVGVVVASLGNSVEVVSGNWGHRVGRATLPRNSLIFIRT